MYQHKTRQRVFVLGWKSGSHSSLNIASDIRFIRRINGLVKERDFFSAWAKLGVVY